MTPTAPPSNQLHLVGVLTLLRKSSIVRSFGSGFPNASALRILSRFQHFRASTVFYCVYSTVQLPQQIAAMSFFQSRRQLEYQCYYEDVAVDGYEVMVHRAYYFDIFSKHVSTFNWIESRVHAMSSL